MMKSKNVEVTVAATLGQSGSVDFECLWKDDTGASGSGAIEFPFGAGNNKLQFKLDDRTGLKLEFMDQPDDAIWFSVDGCPHGGPSDDLGQITDKSVETDQVSAKRKRLTLTNLNTEECTLHYALRFDGAPSGSMKPPYVHDPEIRNRGGGGSN